MSTTRTIESVLQGAKSLSVAHPSYQSDFDGVRGLAAASVVFAHAGSLPSGAPDIGYAWRVPCR